MAKSIIINRFNGKNHTITLPATDTVAATFAQNVLEGEYKVYAFDTEVGLDTETSYKEMQVMVKNTTSEMKTYLNLKVKSTKSEEDVFAAVIGLTVNGILIDEAYVISNKLITL